MVAAMVAQTVQKLTRVFGCTISTAQHEPQFAVRTDVHADLDAVDNIPNAKS
jgi:hypothetical protein